MEASDFFPVKRQFGSRRHPEQSRAAILRAAVQEFAREGLSGARTDAIAQSAKVNKALLYYYFKDKEDLYQAVLERVFGGLADRVNKVLASDLAPREKILAYAGTHFDYIAGNPLYPRIVFAEMTRMRQGKSTQFVGIARNYFQPLFTKLSRVLWQGQASGDFREVDPLQFVPSMIAVIVFYFNTTPIFKVMTGDDPLSPENLKRRRAAVLDFISAALFSRPQDSQGERK